MQKRAHDADYFDAAYGHGQGMRRKKESDFYAATTGFDARLRRRLRRRKTGRRHTPRRLQLDTFQHRMDVTAMRRLQKVERALRSRRRSQTFTYQRLPKRIRAASDADQNTYRSPLMVICAMPPAWRRRAPKSPRWARPRRQFPSLPHVAMVSQQIRPSKYCYRRASARGFPIIHTRARPARSNIEGSFSCGASAISLSRNITFQV